MHPIPTVLFDISGPIHRLSRVNWPGLRKRMVRHRTIRSWGEHFAPIFFTQTGQRQFWQIETGDFCAKQTNFAQTGHTQCRAELCVAALQADSLSTCCEWQKRDRAMKPVLYKMTNDKIALSRFCHSQQVLKESACSAATHNSARRRVWHVCAKFVFFGQKMSISICQNFLWPVCARFAAECPPQLRIVL